ncbi:hypothetical protein BGW38_005269 [Lunasporangiospora selenospora]|uniref:Uncharacterized protein n=1 Tax=Lunasporangiospora selenospora TaxID=979761 RepID=A0A9P6G0E6_9FUNG|nr:hypothetical protein BGW38_005269 [Lunasporangiospora selenospora]
MKLRFTSLDVRATVAALQQSIVGLRLQNVYDVNSRTYLLKFSKLRKHLRARRLTSVKQLGSDRIVDFEFAADDPNNTFHVIAEFYAAGNLILTDGHYKILSILRVVQPNEKVRMAVGETYDVTALTRQFEPIQRDALVNALQSSGPKDMIKKVLNQKFDYGPALMEHTLLNAGLAPNLNVATEFDTSEGSPQLEALFESLQEADKILQGRGSLIRKGYITILRHKKKNPDDATEKELVTYDEFHPYLFSQHEKKEFKEYESFDAAVDEFFSAVEGQRLEVKRRAQEDHAQQKLDTVKMEHFERIRGLEEAQQKNVIRAGLIEANLEMCDQAIMIIRNAIATGMDWKDLADLVEDEKRHGNPIALMIDTLKLESNQICVILSDPYEEDEEDEEEDEQEDEDEQEENKGRQNNRPKRKSTMLINLDINLTAFANARNYYDYKKQSAAKHEKTLAHESKAFKSAEKKIRQKLQEVKITASIQRARKPYWFEKFMWFITSENYLVIAGRDMQQNEILVKRYMKKNDVYVHADIHGAATVLIKNPSETEPVPPTSLYQAGIMSVCQSKAWDAKIVTSAYWVHADQVSKSAPTGEYLTTGSFMIRGKKNFLPPVQLVYGFGFLFKLDDSSIGAHLNERKVIRTTEEENEDRSKTLLSTTAVSESNTVATSSPDPSEKTEKGTLDVPADDNDDRVNVSAEANESEDEDEGGEDESEDKEDSEHKSESKDKEDDDNSDSDESEAAESSDEEFPDTQIQFAAKTQQSQDQKPMQTQASPSKAAQPADKYGLQDYGHDSDIDGDKDSADTASLASTDQKSRSAYITAKMRRDMKRGRAPESSAKDSDGPNLSSSSTDHPTKQQTGKKGQQRQQNQKQQKTKEANIPPPKASVRGKKGKNKKIQEKYGDQDEEDRQLRLELLAPDKGPQLKGRRAKEAEKRAEKKALADKRRLQQEEQQKANAHGGHAAKGNIGKKTPTENVKQTHRAATAHSTDAEESGVEPPKEELDGEDAAPTNLVVGPEDDEEEVRQLLQEENIKMLEPEEYENLTVLDGLTGRPIATDILQFAVPVCAPYGALQKFKYKVKLTPGSMKKGKAYKTSVQHFLMNISTVDNEAQSRSARAVAGSIRSVSDNVSGGDVPDHLKNMSLTDRHEAEVALEAREKELIKLVKDEEAVMAIIGKSKVSAPGVEASKAAKKGRK